MQIPKNQTYRKDDFYRDKIKSFFVPPKKLKFDLFTGNHGIHH